jgi:phytoene/squalene synthetase
MKSLFDKSSLDCSKRITKNYSTSFSLAIKMLSPKIQDDIYAIYGFVRCADEIVDSFEGYDQEELLSEFEIEFHKAYDRKISLNPILNAFQEVVHRFDMMDLVIPFLKSMRMDLHKTEYLTKSEYEEYIFGSADVVGLMCLLVFVEGDRDRYNELKNNAMKLGSAFQKVNFLRDLKHDCETLGRVYFPNIDVNNLSHDCKRKLVAEIEADFKDALIGIKMLPKSAKFGVYTAYKYYRSLLKKIAKTEPEEILNKRIRVDDFSKLFIVSKSYVRYQLNMTL